MALTTKQIDLIKEIHEKKQQGDMNKIAELSGFSRMHVGRCLNINGEHFNEKILKTAVDLILNRQNIAVELLEKIRQ